MAAVIPLILKADPDALSRIAAKVEGEIDKAGASGGRALSDQLGKAISSGGGLAGGLRSAITSAVSGLGSAISSAPAYQSAGDALSQGIGSGGRTFVNQAAQNLLRNGAVSTATLGLSDVAAGYLEKAEQNAQDREGRTAFNLAKSDVSAIGGQLAAAGVEFTDEELGQAMSVRTAQRQRMVDFNQRMQSIEYSEGAMLDSRSFSGTMGR